MKYTSRADLLIAAGESIKMQEKAGCIIPVCKCSTKLLKIELLGYNIPSCEIEFPLAVVEGKPVFVGDELYLDKHKVIKITEHTAPSILPRCSWIPPKPVTVTVEYTIDEAKRVVTALEQYQVPVAAETALIATRKALEKA